MSWGLGNLGFSTLLELLIPDLECCKLVLLALINVSYGSTLDLEVCM